MMEKGKGDDYSSGPVTAPARKKLKKKKSKAARKKAKVAAASAKIGLSEMFQQAEEALTCQNHPFDQSYNNINYNNSTDEDADEDGVHTCTASKKELDAALRSAQTVAMQISVVHSLDMAGSIALAADANSDVAADISDQQQYDGANCIERKHHLYSISAGQDLDYATVTKQKHVHFSSPVVSSEQQYFIDDDKNEVEEELVSSFDLDEATFPSDTLDFANFVYDDNAHDAYNETANDQPLLFPGGELLADFEFSLGVPLSTLLSPSSTSSSLLSSCMSSRAVEEKKVQLAIEDGDEMECYGYDDAEVVDCFGDKEDDVDCYGSEGWSNDVVIRDRDMVIDGYCTSFPINEKYVAQRRTDQEEKEETAEEDFDCAPLLSASPQLNSVTELMNAALFDVKSLLLPSPSLPVSPAITTLPVINSTSSSFSTLSTTTSPSTSPCSDSFTPALSSPPSEHSPQPRLQDRVVHPLRAMGSFVFRHIHGLVLLIPLFFMLPLLAIRHFHEFFRLVFIAPLYAACIFIQDICRVFILSPLHATIASVRTFIRAPLMAFVLAQRRLLVISALLVFWPLMLGAALLIWPVLVFWLMFSSGARESVIYVILNL